ncbi:MAG: arylsulfatase A-like enzyme [Rhodothermales bacterium]|jgi:arylsulfatase A-like enzyme
MDDGKGRASHVVAKHYGIRTERYKLMYVYQHDYWELYDLKKDADETTNLIDNPEYSQIAASLKTRLAEQRQVYADTTGKKITN